MYVSVGGRDRIKNGCLKENRFWKCSVIGVTADFISDGSDSCISVAKSHTFGG